MKGSRVFLYRSSTFCISLITVCLTTARSEFMQWFAHHRQQCTDRFCCGTSYVKAPMYNAPIFRDCC